MPRIPEYPEQVLETVFFPITKGQIVAVDAVDVPLLRPYSWSLSHEAAQAWMGGTMVLMHRFLMGCTKGDGVSVDHRNGDQLDNRRANLRVATHAQNLSNLRIDRRGVRSSRFKGVSWDGPRKKWLAQITVRFEHKFLGRFASETDAAQAYNAEAARCFGEFARLNKV